MSTEQDPTPAKGKRAAFPKNAAPTELPTAEGGVVAVAEAPRTVDASDLAIGLESADPKPVAKTPVNGFYVQAMRDGTYPDRGDFYSRYRAQGAVFELNFVEDFADHRAGGWMRRCQPGEALPVQHAPQIPQTAQRGQKQVPNPFPSITPPG